MEDLQKTLETIRQELVGKIIAIPGHNPIGRVVRVDEQGAWFDEKSRIDIQGLVFYHPVKENYKI